MTRSKLDAFFEKFPFAREAFGKCTVKEACVLPIDETFFDEIPGSDEDEWTADFIFFDRGGHKISQVGVRVVPEKWYLPFEWMRRLEFRETVGDAVMRADASNIAVDSILKFEHGNARMTLFRPPAGFTVQEWLAKIHRDDCDEIQKVIARIDALARSGEIQPSREV